MSRSNGHSGAPPWGLGSTLQVLADDGSGLSAPIPSANTTQDPPAIYLTKVGNAHYFINEETNRIEFSDQRFYKCKDGSMVPSVTTFLDAWPKGAQYFEWLKKHGEDSDEIRDEAGRRGSVVHNLTEQLDLGMKVAMCGENGEPRFKMIEWAMFERYVEFRQLHKPTILETELNMASSKLGYAGTLDRVLMLGGDPWIIDIKTSAAVYDHYHLQTAAYLELYAEHKRMDVGRKLKFRRGILHLNAKTRSYGKGEAIQGPGWQLVESENAFDFDLDLFEACRKMWHATNKNAKPRNIGYSLSHQLSSTTNNDGKEAS